MNKYEVTGTRRQAGAIGAPEGFQEEVAAESSRDAYLQVLTSEGFTHIHVIAIKMKCPTCNVYHMTVPINLYIY